MTQTPQSIPVVIAKLNADTPFGETHTLRQGSKHFGPNSKIHIIHGDSGGCETVVVIGHHRKSGRYIRVRMKIKYFHGFKLGYLYSPKGIALASEFYDKEYQSGYRPTKEDMSSLAEVLPNWQSS